VRGSASRQHGGEVPEGISVTEVGATPTFPTAFTILSSEATGDIRFLLGEPREFYDKCRAQAARVNLGLSAPVTSATNN